MATLPTFDDPALDAQLERYYDELDVLTAQAQAGEIEERDFIAEMERIVAAIIALMFMLGGGSTDVAGAEQVLATRQREHARSIRRLADDIYSGRYRPGEGETAEQAREKLRGRLTLWAGAAAALYREGQVHAPARVSAGGERRERRLQWVMDPAKENCSTCAALNGTVLTASEWRRIGIAPQLVGDGKECDGWRCGCRFVEVEAESVGIDSVPVA
ncbi:MAG: hypothetical protein ACOC8X_13560 [Chloroflexota bacterium]